MCLPFYSNEKEWKKQGGKTTLDAVPVTEIVWVIHLPTSISGQPEMLVHQKTMLVTSVNLIPSRLHHLTSFV